MTRHLEYSLSLTLLYSTPYTYTYISPDHPKHHQQCQKRRNQSYTSFERSSRSIWEWEIDKKEIGVPGWLVA
jgi:hypothetical protein